MTYLETLDYLYAQLPMFSRIGAAAYKKDLHNTLALLEHLDNPHNKFRSVHIAGTNGKGSTSHMLAAVFQTCGYKTGLYTSPHIHHFGERIKVNGAMIDEGFVISFVEKLKPLMAELQPSFFEVTVAMAYSWFAEQQVDVAVIETGLGGREDSTNVITPVLSVITNIGYDHMNILGNTLEEIAGQKAGIIKENVPVVIGQQLPETRPVFISEANKKNAPIFFAEEEYITEFIDPEGSMLICHHKRMEDHVMEKLQLDLVALYQVNNSRTALAAIDQLRKLKFRLSPQQVHEALGKVRELTGLKGRWDLQSRHPDLIYDVGHNADGIRQILKQLDQDYPTTPRHMIMGFVKDKDISLVLELLPKSATYYFTQAHIPRALPVAELAAKAKEFALQGNVYENVSDAINAARNEADEDDVIVVFGSFFVIAEAP
jgi:dihydrofolate synthase/folylpolyglutamate synthase